MRVPLAVCLVLLFAIAGCFGGPKSPQGSEGPSPSPTATDDEFTPFDPDESPDPTPGQTGTTRPSTTGGAIPPPPPGRPFAAFSVFDTGGQWGEPSIGLTESGALFVTAATDVLRSKDNGETWSSITSSLQFTTFDPYLWVDTDTNRVFHLNLLVGGSFLAISDNDGDTWTQIPYAGGPGDHQKLTTGPPSPQIPGSGVAYPNVVYYSVNNQVSTVSLSLDGGRSWGPEAPISPPLLCGQGGLAGQPHGTNTGTILLPYYQSCSAAGGDSYDTVYVAQSLNGASWGRFEVSRAYGGGFFDPDLASDQDGNVYLAYMGGAAGNYSLYLARSENDGSSWKEPVRLAPQQLGTILFPTIVAGAEGQLWVSYLATDEGALHPNEAPETTEWYLYTTHVSGAHTAEMVATTYLVDAHPVHVGRVSTEGFTPEGETSEDNDRNLLEFIDSTIDLTTGRLWITYTDGCPAETCTKKSQSNGDDVLVARLDAGPNLWSPPASIAALS